MLPNHLSHHLHGPDWVPRTRTGVVVAREPEAAGRRAIERVSKDRPADAPPLLSGVTIGPLLAADPELTYTFGGEQKEQLESMNALGPMFGIAMILIFALLAIPLGSCTKPFIIMAIIPFGFIGVVLGHLILGVTLSTESFIGLFALAGVVVNDSLVMIDFIDQELEEGLPARTASG